MGPKLKKYVVAMFRTLRERHRGAWLLLAMLQAVEALIISALLSGDLDETIEIAAMEFRDEAQG